MASVIDWLSDCRRLLRPRGPSTASERLLVVIVTVTIAIGVSVVTGGRWTWLLVGGAAAVSLLALVPGLSWLVKPVGVYLGVWLAFNVGRAWADNTEWADQTIDLVPHAEAWLLPGDLPSALLQQHFYEPASLDWTDYGLTVVYLSFFAVPHLVALLLLWRNRRLFWHYVLATTILFAISLVSFFLLPTAPPWMVAEAAPEADFPRIRRVTEEVLRALELPVRVFNERERGSARVSEVRIEPNPIAAMPSIHFAATAMIVFPALRAGRIMSWAAVVYTGLMGLALVYLGEHYPLDLAAGGILAWIGWVSARGCLGRARRGRPTGRAAADQGESDPRPPWREAGHRRVPAAARSSAEARAADPANGRAGRPGAAAPEAGEPGSSRRGTRDERALPGSTGSRRLAAPRPVTRPGDRAAGPNRPRDPGT